MIKTANEIANEQASILIDTCGLVNNTDRFSLVLVLTKQNQKIQLDAIKHGMTIAAEECSKTVTCTGFCQVWNEARKPKEIEKAILTARDNLKEI